MLLRGASWLAATKENLARSATGPERMLARCLCCEEPSEFAQGQHPKVESFGKIFGVKTNQACPLTVHQHISAIERWNRMATMKLHIAKKLLAARYCSSKLLA